MTTNRLMAEREISARERLQKTAAGVLVYAIGAGAIWYFNQGWPALGSPVFFGALAASIIWTAYIVKFAITGQEKATSKDGIRMIRMRIADDRAGRTWLSRIGLNSKLLVLRFVFFGGLTIAAGGLYILGKQVYTFAMTQSWVPVAIAEFMKPAVMWLATKDIWLTGQTILIKTFYWLNAGFVFAFLGAVVALYGLSTMDRVKDRAVRQR